MKPIFYWELTSFKRRKFIKFTDIRNLSITKHDKCHKIIKPSNVFLTYNFY